MSQYRSVADLETYIQALESRIEALERTKVTHGQGAPGTGVSEPYVDDLNSKVYYRVNGVLKSATLA